uniref:Regulator of chromosome condensation n=1 Tax=Mesocestoides corti TaxID=53468 RepID=A0A5K3FNM2_MESCO
MALRSRKRQRVLPVSDVSKRRKVDTFADVGTAELATRHTGRFASSGTVLTLGTGDTGQLGLGPDITERMKPALMPPASLSSAGLDQDSAEDFIQVVAGGMHTVCLTSDGRVFTFGCNDEGALGRPSGDSSSDNDDGKPKTESVEESRPGVVNFPENCVKIKMVSAGDSHSAALDNQGRVWLWGTFRGASGAIGLTKAGEICCSPVHLASLTAVVVKITSGQDHLVCLTDDGRLFTIGCGEQGQLGRIAERFAKDGGRSGIDFLLQPGECRLRGSKRFVDVWAGGFATIARMTSGVIYACGLNNYGQLALVKQKPERDKEMEVGETIPENTESVTELEKLSESMLSRKQGPLVQFMLTPACGFDPETDWTQFAIGMHHTLALTAAGELNAFSTV